MNGPCDNLAGILSKHRDVANGIAANTVVAMNAARYFAHSILSVGLACVAAAFLVAPLIDSTVPDCQTILVSLGTTVLEAAAWAMAASAARQSRKTLVAAAFARLCVAFGHLLGALIARSMLVLSNADASAIQAGSLVIVFVYFMVALFLGRASTEAFVQIEKGSTARETDNRVAALEETATLIGMGEQYMRPQRKRSRSRKLGPYACRTSPEAFCAHQSTNEHNVAYGIRCHMRRPNGART